VVLLVVVGGLMWRGRLRRRHIGSGAAGAVYDLLNDEKRKAVEIVVEDRAGESDPERAADVPPDDPAPRGGTGPRAVLDSRRPSPNSERRTDR
jgi:hypothetical protein